MTAAPHIFTTVAEAKAALVADGLGTVYFRASEVFVATSAGTGTFPKDQWYAEGGAHISVGAAAGWRPKR